MAEAPLPLLPAGTSRRAARLPAGAWPRRMQSAARRATVGSFLAHAACAFALALDGARQPALLYPPPRGPTSLPQAAATPQQALVEYDAPLPAPEGAPAALAPAPRRAAPAAHELEAFAGARPRTVPTTPLGTLPAQIAAPDDAAAVDVRGDTAEASPAAAPAAPPEAPAAPAAALPRQDVAQTLQAQVESRAATAAAALQGALVAAAPLGETNPEPVYPAAALAQRLAGLVLIRAWVDARGRVVQAEIYESSGHALLDEAALDAVRRWRFAPARLDGEPTSCEVAIPVRFVIPE